MDNDWRVIFSGFFHDLYNAWMPSLISGLIIALLTPIIGWLTGTKKGLIVGFALAITIAAWTVAGMLIRHVSSQPIPLTEPPQPARHLPQGTTQQPPAKRQPGAQVLSEIEMAMLVLIAHHSDCTTEKLAAHLGVSEQKILHHKDKLEEHDYLEHGWDWTDREEYYHLSPQGRKVLNDRGLL